MNLLLDVEGRCECEIKNSSTIAVNLFFVYYCSACTDLVSWMDTSYHFSFNCTKFTQNQCII